MIYLDFAKAFDKMNHGVLLHKLKKLGITGNLGKWIFNFSRTGHLCVENTGRYGSQPIATHSREPLEKKRSHVCAECG